MYKCICISKSAARLTATVPERSGKQKTAEALSRRTNFKKHDSRHMSHSRRFHGRRAIKNDVFDVILVSGHPSGDPRRLERGPDRIQGGPGIDFRRFVVAFWLQWRPQGMTFGVLFDIFPICLSLFRCFFSRGVVFGRFRDPSDI